MLSHTLSLCLTQITTKMAYSNQAFVEAAVLLKSYLHNTTGFTSVVILSLSYDPSEKSSLQDQKIKQCHSVFAIQIVLLNLFQLKTNNHYQNETICTYYFNRICYIDCRLCGLFWLQILCPR